jgi:hypothetical protein
VKTSLTGFLCLCVLELFRVSPGYAQQEAPPQDTAAQQAAPQQAPPQQAPPQQANPQGQVPANPQAAPKPSAVAPQEAPTPQDVRTGPIVKAPPELPKYPDVRLPGETGWWLGITVWLPKEQPIFDRGHAATFPQASLVTMQGRPKYVGGAEFGVALGLHNALKISYWGARAAGDIVAGQDLTLWSQVYSKGWPVSTNYRVQDLKMSFDYLTWPYPVESRKFRLKTLWQLQYISVRSVFDAPTQPLVDATGAPLIDATGNPITYRAQGTKWWMTPTIGLGLTQYISRNVRIDINGSGFGIPHKWTVWDTDATANFRFGHFELQAGAKAFHFKSSPANVFFVRNTMASVFFGIRWYSE